VAIRKHGKGGTAFAYGVRHASLFTLLRFAWPFALRFRKEETGFIYSDRKTNEVT
jgi:hypothetical protein